jgi:hypothetical protein
LLLLLVIVVVETQETQNKNQCNLQRQAFNPWNQVFLFPLWYLRQHPLI